MELFPTGEAGERAGFGPFAAGDRSAKAGAIATGFLPLGHTSILDCPLQDGGQTKPVLAVPCHPGHPAHCPEERVFRKLPDAK